MMKTLLLLGSSLALVTGCSFAARSPEMFRSDTAAVLASRNDAIRACYDGVLKKTPGAQGNVAVSFVVETHHGQIVRVAVDSSQTTAPAAVADCVTQNLNGLALNPPDAREGLAHWMYHFAPPPAAAPGQPGSVDAKQAPGPT